MPTERGGDGPNPISRNGGDGPTPLWEVTIRRFGSDGPIPLALVPVRRGEEVSVRWGDIHQLGTREQGKREASMPDVTLVTSSQAVVLHPPSDIQKAAIASLQQAGVTDIDETPLVGEPPQLGEVVGTGPHKESVLVHFEIVPPGPGSFLYLAVAGRDPLQTQSLHHSIGQALFPRLTRK